MAQPPGSSTNVIYTSPHEVFEAFDACPRLRQANVRHYWGSIEDKPNATGSRAVWQVQAYGCKPPVQQHDVVVQEPGPDGSRRSYKALHKVDAQVTVRVELFVDKNGPLTEWQLFSLYALAAAQVLKVENRYQFGASLDARDQLSVATDRLAAQLVFHIPIHELIPTANPANDSVSLRSE